MPDSNEIHPHLKIKQATKDCACILLDYILEERPQKLSEIEVRKLLQLASNWLSGKNLYAEEIRHTIATEEFVEYRPDVILGAEFGVTRILSDISRGAIPLIDQLLGAVHPEAKHKTIQALSFDIPFMGVEHSELPTSRACNTSHAEALCINSLTARETEILQLLGKGLSIKGTARGLSISPGTVKWHVKNLYEKLGASSREDALSKARLRQLIH